jgi:hypothetical protein
MSSPLVLQYVEALWVRFTPPATIWSTEHADALQRDHDGILRAVRDGDAEAAGKAYTGTRRVRDAELTAVRTTNQPQGDERSGGKMAGSAGLCPDSRLYEPGHPQVAVAKLLQPRHDRTIETAIFLGVLGGEP